LLRACSVDLLEDIDAISEVVDRVDGSNDCYGKTMHGDNQELNLIFALQGPLISGKIKNGLVYPPTNSAND
jgi:hypothetical protein